MRIFHNFIFIGLLISVFSNSPSLADSPLINEYKSYRSTDQVLSFLKGKWRLKKYELAPDFSKQSKSSTNITGEFIIEFSTKPIPVLEQPWPVNFVFKNFYSPWNEHSNELANSSSQQNYLNENIKSTINVISRAGKSSSLIVLDFNSDIRRVWARGSNVGDGNKTIQFLSNNSMVLTGTIRIFMPTSSLELPYDTITFEKVAD